MALSGHHLQVAILHDPPTDIITKSANGSVLNFLGISGNIFREFQERLNFSFDFVPAEIFGTYKNGVSTGAVGLVHRREIDLVASTFYYTPQRAQVVDYLYPFFSDQGILMMNKKNLVTSNDRIHFLLQPFTPNVWVAIIAMIFFTSVVLFGIIKQSVYVPVRSTARSKLLPIRLCYIQIIENLFRILLQQGINVKFARGPTRFILAGCWLGAIVLTASYIGQYVAMFTNTNKFQLPINSFEELSESEKWKPVINKGYAVIDTLNGTRYGRKILRKLDACSECLVDTTPGAVDLVSGSEEYAYLASFLWSKHLINAKYAEEKSCNLFLSRNNNSPTFGSFIIPKGSKYRDTFNKQIFGLVEGGIVDKWVHSYFPTESKCFTVTGSPRLPSPAEANSSLRLDVMHSIFMIWAVGLALATVTLSLEHINKKLVRLVRRFHLE